MMHNNQTSILSIFAKLFIFYLLFFLFLFFRFDPVLSLRQLKYAGLFEAIHIRRAGYAIRMPVAQFVQRYKHCSMVSVKIKKTDNVDLRALAQTMLIELSPKLGIENPTTGMASWAVGLTRVFLRTLKVKYALEECRNNSVDFVALQIQRYARFVLYHILSYGIV